MAPPRDEGTETDPAPPTAFATGSAQDRDELRAADLRSAPRPSRLDAPSVQTLKGAGPKLAAAAADMGLGSVGDMLLHVPHSYRDRASRESSPSCGSARRRRSRSTCARRACGPRGAAACGSWRRRSPTTPGRRRPSGSTRPGSPTASPRARGCSCSASSTAPAFACEAHELLGGGRPRPPESTRPGSCPSIPPSERLRAQRLREWAWQALPLAR